MAKKSLKVKCARPQNIKQENIIDAKFVEDHILILENMEFAVFALEN